MLISHWMTSAVITITPDRSMMKASKLMKDNNIHRLPVVDENGVLVGIITDHDVKEASPSKATTLDMHELYYLLSEIKAKDIMTKTVITVRKGDTIEKAAAIMMEKNIGGLPVVDDNRKVEGIITDKDVFKALIQTTGVLHGGVQFGLRLSNKPGGLVPALDFLKDNGARLMSILTSYEPTGVEMRDVFFRIKDMDKPSLNKIKEGLEERFEMLYWTRDPVNTLVS